MVKIAFAPALACLALLLPAAPAAAQGGKVTAEIGKEKVDFAVGGRTVTSYHFKGVDKPIFYPVYTPNGVMATRHYPLKKGVEGETNDHPHHVSVWFCHGDVIPEGMELKRKVKGVEGVDFWSTAPGHGDIVCVAVEPGESGKNFASIDTKNEWRTADGRKVLDERRKVTVYDFGNARLFVFDINLIATLWTIIFGDTKEGSMAIRINDAINERSGGKLTNAEGQHGEKNVWGHKSDWCDYSGTADGKTFGVAIFDDPGNDPRASWHSRGYGLMAANPFGRKGSGFPAVKGSGDLVELPKGESLHLRYGVLVHNGDVQSGDVAEYYRRFVELGKTGGGE